MANKGFYDEKDIPAFQEEVCKKKCVMNGKCIDLGYNNHFFLMCPHYHSWKLGYSSFVWEQLEYYRNHPEEAEANRKKNLEVAKKMKEEKKGTKKKSEED